MKPVFRKLWHTLKELKSAGELAVWLGASAVAGAALWATFWPATNTTVTLRIRPFLGEIFGLLAALISAIWLHRKKEEQIAQLESDVVKFQQEIAGLRKPKRNTTSGELIVDDIRWAYTGDNDTGEWLSFAPLCPHCNFELHVQNVSDVFALEPGDLRIRYRCDNKDCGKFDETFIGTSADREDKAARHIRANAKRQ